MHSRADSIEKIDNDELKLFEIRKHPLGIILLYVQSAFGMTLAAGLAYFLLPVVFEDTDQAFFIANIFTAISVSVTFLVVLIATIIYRENRLLVTDRNVTQILQFGLFNRKVSQLNLNNVEDVTAVQNGILPTAFNYGILKIETAGEQVNFHFSYCPNAGYYAKIILDARERMLGQAPPLKNSATGINSLSLENGSANSNGDREKTAAEAIKDLGAETVKQASTRIE